jgi:hypothetical protein
MLRLREAHLKHEAQRCHLEADELRAAAWALQHREGAELLEDVLASPTQSEAPGQFGTGRWLFCGTHHLNCSPAPSSRR